jgi:hypothetical protein
MLTELLEFIVNWRTGLIVLLVFGFAPGAVLRLIVLAFHRDDPRRGEMLAELHGVPRWERPIWVVEQLEVALFEGVWERIVWAATGRIIERWHLNSGVKLNRKHPTSFWIPDEDDKQAIEPGVVVKLMFTIDNVWGRHVWGERMWVQVVAIKKRHIVGRLLNEPLAIPRLGHGDRIKFKRDHIIDIDWHSEILCEPSEQDGPERTQTVPLCMGCNGHGNELETEVTPSGEPETEGPGGT